MRRIRHTGSAPMLQFFLAPLFSLLSCLFFSFRFLPISTSSFHPHRFAKPFKCFHNFCRRPMGQWVPSWYRIPKPKHPATWLSSQCARGQDNSLASAPLPSGHLIFRAFSSLFDLNINAKTSLNWDQVNREIFPRGDLCKFSNFNFATFYSSLVLFYFFFYFHSLWETFDHNKVTHTHACAEPEAGRGSYICFLLRENCAATWYWFCLSLHVGFMKY